MPDFTGIELCVREGWGLLVQDTEAVRRAAQAGACAGSRRTVVPRRAAIDDRHPMIELNGNCLAFATLPDAVGRPVSGRRTGCALRGHGHVGEVRASATRTGRDYPVTSEGSRQDPDKTSVDPPLSVRPDSRSHTLSAQAGLETVLRPHLQFGAPAALGGSPWRSAP